MSCERTTADACLPCTGESSYIWIAQLLAKGMKQAQNLDYPQLLRFGDSPSVLIRTCGACSHHLEKAKHLRILNIQAC